jgi:hypothetical protein
VRIREVARTAMKDLAAAIAADFREFNRRFNPWFQQSELRDQVRTLRSQRLAEEAISKAQAMEIEKQRARIDWLDAQATKFESELEKLRLRLSAPAQESGPERPKTWPDLRRELELKYATTHVNEEPNNASQGNAS